MSFSPHRLYGQIDGQKITERCDGNTKEIYNLGSRSFELNPYNIPSYTNKVYEQFLVTSSISCNTLKDAVYCPYNYSIYFSNSNVLYKYSLPDSVISTASVTTYDIYGVCYAPSSNSIFFTWGEPLSQSAPRALYSLKCDTGVITSLSQTDSPGICSHDPNLNLIYVSDSVSWNWVDIYNATNLSLVGQTSMTRGYRKFIYCPSTTKTVGISPGGDVKIFNNPWTIIGTISADGYGIDAYRGAYCPSTDKIYFTSSSNREIFITDPISRIVIKTIDLVSAPQEIAYIPSCNRIMFTMGNDVYSINPNTQTIVGTITGVGTSTRFLSYSPYNDRIYVGVTGAITSFKYW